MALRPLVCPLGCGRIHKFLLLVCPGSELTSVEVLGVPYNCPRWAPWQSPPQPHLGRKTMRLVPASSATGGSREGVSCLLLPSSALGTDPCSEGNGRELTSQMLSCRSASNGNPESAGTSMGSKLATAVSFAIVLVAMLPAQSLVPCLVPGVSGWSDNCSCSRHRILSPNQSQKTHSWVTMVLRC